MQKIKSELDERGATLVAISADKSADMDAMKEKLSLSMQIISDPELKLAAAYGVRQGDKDVPLPATYVLGKDGVITFAEVGISPKGRPSNESLLGALK